MLWDVFEAYVVGLYTCQNCQHLLGNKKFDESALKNYKYQGDGRLVCTQCKKISGATAVQQREKEKAKKMKDLAQGMTQTDLHVPKSFAPKAN